MKVRTSRWRALSSRALALAAFLAVSARTGGAQSPSPSPATTLLRQLYGDVAIEVQRVPPSDLRVAAADANRALAVSLAARDVIRWTDSATRVIDARLHGKEQTGMWQAVVEEPGTASGSIVIAKTISETDTTIAVLVADSDFDKVRFTLDPQEARAFVLALRRVARMAVAPPRRARSPKDSTARPPARPLDHRVSPRDALP